MGDVSKNFNRADFACKCGCGFDDVSLDLVDVLQGLRDWFARPITVTSGCRCPDHNGRVGGSPTSQHLAGHAADIVVDGVPADEVYRRLTHFYPYTYGIGQYDSFTHIDVRQKKARW